MVYVTYVIIGGFYGPSGTFVFVDLQLDVKGCRDVYASFDKYVEVERLEGDNKYHAEQYGLQVNSSYMYGLSSLQRLSCCLLHIYVDTYPMKKLC